VGRSPVNKRGLRLSDITPPSSTVREPVQAVKRGRGARHG